MGQSLTPAGVAEALALHWDGSAWAIVPTANPSAASNILWSVSGAAGSDVWAVGNHLADGGGLQTLIEHWDGAEWTAVDSPNDADAQTNYLWGVDVVDADHVWAGGYSITSGVDQVLVGRWDGAAWSTVE